MAAALAVLAIGATWPLAADPAHRSFVRPEDNDYRLNMYLIFWGAHALLQDPATLHHTNMFHPERYTFAYSDIELSHSLLALPSILLFSNPVLTYNLLLLTSLVLGGTGAYYLGRHLTGCRPAAFLGAVIFAFNPAHFARWVQIQLFGDHWLPWFALALLLWLEACAPASEALDGESGSPAGSGQAGGGFWSPGRLAVAAALLYCLHALTGSHNAVFGTLLGVTMSLYYGIRLKLWASRRFWVGSAVIVGICLLLVGPVFYPYLLLEGPALEHRVGDVWSLDHSSAKPRELLTADSRFYRWLDDAVGWPSSLFARPPRSLLFPGVVPLALAVLGLVRAGRGSRRETGGIAPTGRGLAAVAAWSSDLVALAAAILAGTYAATGRAPDPIEVLPGNSPAVWLLALAAAAVAARLWLAPATVHLASLPLRIRALKWSPGLHRLFWLLFLAGCLLVSLGPHFGFYLALAQLPGVRLMRVPSRFTLPAYLALAMLATYGAASLVRTISSRKRGVGRRGVALLVAVGLIFAGEALYAPKETFPFDPRPPQVYEWLGRQPGDFAVFEYPVSPDIPTIHARQVFYSIYHWKKLLVGYSGWQSEANRRRLERLQRTFPSAASLDELQALDVRYVLLFTGRVSNERLQRVHESPRLRPVQAFGAIVVYELLPETSTAGPPAPPAARHTGR